MLNSLVCFYVFELRLFNLVWDISEKEGPKVCVKRFGKGKNIIETRLIEIVTWMVLIVDACPRQPGLAGWAGLAAGK